MIDITAAFRLVNAANQNGFTNLLGDAVDMYKAYEHAKSVGGFHTKDYDMKRLIDSIAGVASAAQALTKDPNNLNDIITLINSL